MDHLFSAIEKLRNIHALYSRRNHSKIRQRGISAADARHAEKYLAKVLRLGGLLQRRARIGDGDKLPADKKAPIEAALNKLKDAQKTQNVPAIDSAIAEMNNAWTAASEELYKATQQAGGSQGQGGPGGQQDGGGHEAHAGGGENVTDAEFEEVK